MTIKNFVGAVHLIAKEQKLEAANEDQAALADHQAAEIRTLQDEVKKLTTRQLAATN